MRLHLGDDVEIARRRAVSAGIAVAGDAHARAGLHAGGNAHLDRIRAAHAAFAAAGAADRCARGRCRRSASRSH